MTLSQKSVLFLSLSLPALAATASPAAAPAWADTDYLTPARVRIEPVADSDLEEITSLNELDAPKSSSMSSDLDELEVIVDKVINIGSKVWAIVEKNRPVVNVDAAPVASAVPQGVRTWADLGGWSSPATRAYRVVFENVYGIDVVDFTFRITYTYGGSFKGKGRYLTNVTIVPANLSVAWFYKFAANVQVKNVTNAGSTASPLAGMELQLNYAIDTAVKHEQSSLQYYVRGDGHFVDLNR